MDGSCSDDSEFEVKYKVTVVLVNQFAVTTIQEELAGGGPGPIGGGPEQEDRRADDVYPECWRSIH
jgi:hypothetical protein